MAWYKKTLLIIVLLALTVGAAVIYLFRSEALNIKQRQFVYLNASDNTDSLILKLVKDCGLKHPYAFKFLAGKMNLAPWIKKGRYTLKPEMTLKDLIITFREGKLKTCNLVISAYQNLEQFAGKCGRRLEGDSIDFYHILNDSVFLDSIGFSKQNVYALIIPDTYNIPWHTTPDELMMILLEEYRKFWHPERFHKTSRCGLSPIEVSILASIVAKETNKTDEMPVVAGMYINRLKMDMHLQADPSVKFALNDTSIKRILNVHLTIPSPYNTYLHKGLPPGPLCIVPVQALEAVLNFAEHDYLFMCAREDFSGYHNFAKDYKTHQKNAKKYSKALDQRGIR